MAVRFVAISPLQCTRDARGRFQENHFSAGRAARIRARTRAAALRRAWAMGPPETALKLPLPVDLLSPRASNRRELATKRMGTNLAHRFRGAVE